MKHSPKQLWLWILLIFVIALVAYSAITVMQRATRDEAATLKSIQKLNKLETIVYRYEKIIDEQSEGGAFKQFLFGDRILLVAEGEVVAGVDLNKLDKNSIKISASTITITLPAPEIFHTKLDNERTRVYDRQQGILTKGDDELESKARAEAEQVIRKQACTDAILTKASESAASQITSLLNMLEFSEVHINTTPASCS